MRLSYWATVVIASLVSAEQTLTFTVSSTTATSVTCATQKVSTPVKGPVPTTTSTKTLPPNIVLIISASTPVATTTKTLTSTSTKTTVVTSTTTIAGVTSTFSTTSTLTASTTTVITSFLPTTTQTTTTVTSTATSVVPPPEDFEGVEESTSQTDFAGKKKRDLHGTRLLRRGLSKRTNPAAYKYVKSVTCVKYIQVTYYKKIVAIKPTSTRTVYGPTSTVTTTSTVNSTSSVAPTASTTVSFSTTITVTGSTTVFIPTTTTATVTETTVTTTTSYAACAPTNILGPQLSSGAYIADVIFTDDRSPIITETANSAYDCCVNCLLDPAGCFYSIYQAGTCTRRDQVDFCNNPNYLAGQFTRTNVPPGIIISNGPCGIITDSGDG